MQAIPRACRWARTPTLHAGPSGPSAGLLSCPVALRARRCFPPPASALGASSTRNMLSYIQQVPAKDPTQMPAHSSVSKY